ncbi:MAG TPA: hypothetical protein VGS21_02485, partial [Acidimicrobiales bacterium]|nr:hypothetical protein [Acidimicrobiales bacterium]
RRLAGAAASLSLLAAGTLFATGISTAGGATTGRHPTPPRATSNSLDPMGPQGMNVDAAQSGYTTGDPNVIVAYVEGGINWYGDDGTLASAVYVNWHETPVPCTGSTMVVGGVTEPCATDYSVNEDDYDLAHPMCVENKDCMIRASDWANDPRVGRTPTVGFITPENLIAAFSGPGYNPPAETPSGFAHAISGWDFYDNQNDPATYDAAYGHANGQMSKIHQICPNCSILPIKAGDEAVDSTDQLARAWLFAAESGARVIVSVTADLGYSSFAREVLAYIHKHGVIVVESSNDFDSNDHQGGMYWDNVIPGNGLVVNTNALPSAVWSQSNVPGPEWTRSDLTSWGPHAMFSVATGGGSTSESTPTTGGLLALLLSYGNKAFASSLIPENLTGPEAVSVLRTASSQVPNLANLPTPANPADEWNEQYGWGMPNELAAMQAVQAGDVAPAASIDSPQWYADYDPTKTQSVTVTGDVQSEPGQALTWQLQWGLGGDPSTFTTFASGTNASGGTANVSGVFDTSNVPSSFYAAAFHLSTNNWLPSSDQYTVTFRLEVQDTGPGPVSQHGEARLAVNVWHDSSLMPGFPLQMSSSGESQPALADLQGSGRLDIVFGTADGYIHAIDPSTGKDIPGWPVHTDAITDPNLPAGVNPGYEPVISDIAVGDLTHSGRLDVVATSSAGRVYAWSSSGAL